MSDGHDGEETPRPPETAEFGSVTPGGPPHRYPPRDGILVTKLSVGPYDNDVYVIASEGSAIVVDGAAEPERILQAADGLTIVAIVQTHDHPDHVQALAALAEATGAPVLAHPDDRWPVATDPIRDGDVVRAGGAALTAMHTPGHTPGSTCYLLRYPSGAPSRVFTGDTLFPGGPGNTNRDAAAFGRIMESLDRLFELPDDTGVSPGHGLDTTIGRERPYVEAWRRRGW